MAKGWKRGLTTGEWRRLERRRSRTTINERARSYGLTRAEYLALERDRKPAPTLGRNISNGEWCAVMRWRAGLTMDQVAKKAGISKLWVLMTETNRGGESDRLAEFWRGR